MQQIERPVLRSRVWPAACGALVMLLLVIATVGVDQPVTAGIVVACAIGCMVAVVVWATLRSRRQRRIHEEALTTWASERAAQAERLRIARELHDLASHGLGLMTLRAAAARRVEGPDGEAERLGALADIEQAGRAAITELRRMLTVLRTPGDSEAPLRPADTLEDLPQIAAAAAATGVRVQLTCGPVGAVSAGAQVTAAAIVREALANTARHAGPGHARVTVGRAAGSLVVTVDDDGPSSGWLAHPGSGHGLAGLRERVAALGGELAAGVHGRGFRVRALLPDGAGR